MASLRNANGNQRILQQNHPVKPVTRKPLGEFPKHAAKPLSVAPQVKQEESKKAAASIGGKLPTLSSLRDTLPLAKRQRLLQEIVRTAGKENGFLGVRDRPANVEDIYKDDLDNESLVVAYVEHIYAYLHEREANRVNANYMEGMSINPRMRAILIDWIVSVVYKFKMCQDTLFLTVDIVDRFLAVPNLDITKDELQLVGVTAMFIASKFEEVYPPELEDYVFIADNACSKIQIVETEMIMANALNFDFTRPCATQFVRRCCKAAGFGSEEYCTAKYIMELTLLNLEFVAMRPSLIAAAASYLTMVFLKNDKENLWDTNMEYYSFYSEKEVNPLAARLLNLIIEAPKCRQQCVYKKYCSPKFSEVAIKVAKCVEDAVKHFST